MDIMRVTLLASEHLLRIVVVSGQTVHSCPIPTEFHLMRLSLR
jgi:hypothetical protein